MKGGKFKTGVDKIWKYHPESKNFPSIEDFAKLKIKTTTAPATSTAVTEVVSDAGGAISRTDEAAGVRTTAPAAEAGEAGRAVQQLDDAAGAVRATESSAAAASELLIKETDDIGSFIRKLQDRTFDLSNDEIKVLNKLVENDEFAAELLKAENSGAFKRFNNGYGSPKLDAVLMKLGERIRANPAAIQTVMTEAAETSTPVAKEINLRRAGKIAAAVAAGF
jgi:hypothetical protein